jgi:copper homeostasis protein CutC
MRRKLEIAAFNLESALIAQQNGASRVELCKDLELGGTTPEADAVAYRYLCYGTTKRRRLCLYGRRI